MHTQEEAQKILDDLNVIALREQRRVYAEHIVACVDTVSLLRPEEVQEIYDRAASGEFDAYLGWRSEHLR